MFELRCPVRNCEQMLRRRENQLQCVKGHSFDRAKQGYWPLLQPQDRKSLDAGDSEAAVFARQRWLERGHADGLIEALRPWIALSESQRTLDLGCGDGTFGPALFSDSAESFCGIDLSKRAIKLASRRWPAATWVLANADRTLPVANQSVHRVVSLFGRRPTGEIRRVLVDGGYCIVAVPGEEDLIELREKVQQAGRRRSRWELVVEEFSRAGLELVEHKLWQHAVDLPTESIADAMAMSYRAVRYSEQARLKTLGAMRVTLAADLILLQ